MKLPVPYTCVALVQASVIWGLVPPVRQESGQGEEECSELSETEMGKQDMLEEEAVQARDGPIESPSSPTLLPPRTRRSLKTEEQ